MKWLVLALAVVAAAARAERIVVALDQDLVEITANFDGSEISVFGAVAREAPVAEDAAALDVIVTARGPMRRVTVRRKERRFGIWINADSVEIDAAPTFYAIATSGPADEILSATDDLRYRVGLERLITFVGAPPEIGNAQSFPEALARIRRAAGLYAVHENTVELVDDVLFRTAIPLPANLVEGDYTISIFLVRGREVIATQTVQIPVRKVGLERLIYTTAHEQPLLYGIISILVALAAGWLASEAFRRLRR